jgi:hypothetical protein
VKVGNDRLITVGNVDDELIRLIDVWPMLSETVRMMIRAAVDIVHPATSGGTPEPRRRTQQLKKMQRCADDQGLE